MTRARSDSLELLKAWYLATLRKRAVASQANLTPAALINADRKEIERLVLSGVGKTTPSKKFQTPAIQRAITVSIGITFGFSLLMIGLTLGLHSWLLTLTALIAATGSGIAFCLVVTKLLVPFDQIGKSLADKGYTTSSYDGMPRVFDQILSEREELEGGKVLIVEASPDALCCSDADANIHSLNGSLSSFLGSMPEELFGASLLDLVLPDDQEKLIAGLSEAKSKGAVPKLDLRFLTRTSQARDLRLSMDWSRSSELFFICAKDVSDEKQLERARTEYLSTISHDIKIPLTSVLLSIESLGKGDKPPESQRAAILRVEASIEKLIAIINELLEYENSAVSGRLPLRYSNVVVSELVDDVVDVLSAQAGVKQIELSVDAVNITAQIDRVKIQRVIVNLLSNAIKFTPAGGKIHISALRDSEMLEFKVTDTGPGIPEQYKRIIFERYERIPDRQDIEGSGLGLSICKTIVEAHGGLIGVKTAPRGGSEFWFNVPLRSE